MTKRTPPDMTQDSIVETTKIDPRAFLEGALEDIGAQPSAEQGRDLEPMDFRSAPVREAKDRAVEKARAESAAEKFLPPEETKDVLDETVKGDLISRLEERFGMKPEVLHEVALEANGQELKVSMRLPLYDDFIWAIAIIEQKVERGEDLSLLQTDNQREQILQHLTTCRAVLKIEGEWIWDVFGMREMLKQSMPSWDGESYQKLPDLSLSVMAKKVYDFFRHRLHSDILFELNKRVTELLAAHGPSKANKKDAEVKEGADPTPAP